MNIIRKINDELAIAGQITLDQLQQIGDEGYRSVVNLRLSDETGFLVNEQEKTERDCTTLTSRLDLKTLQHFRQL
ncbi:hypothetical protein [uncultured Nostoc sp.]|uniref:hypothetical protein n=1 Tax=uncultured Nostoc sp. TaxID=340711 RepID=UPI0035CC0956